MNQRWIGALLILVLAIGTGCEAPAERTLEYRLPEDPPNLDPYRASDDNSLVYIYLLFDGLVEYVPGTTEVRPAVAESWDISADGLTYTFKLRQGVRFHHGREVTADDVVFSLQRALTPAAKSQKKDFLQALEGSEDFWNGVTESIAGVSSPDPSTIVLTLSYPYSPFLTVLASEAGAILPRDVYSDPGESYLRHPVGCGPFSFSSWEPGVSIRLERFDSHWKPAPPDPIPGIRFRFIKNSSTAMEEYRAGNVDFIMEVPPGQRQFIREEMPEAFRNWPRLSVMFIGFNFRAGPLADNLPLRQAINHAIDRDFIVDVLGEGKDVAAAGLIPPGMLGFDPDREPPAYDPDRAARLLEEAGYPGGKGLDELDYLSNETEGFRRIAERIQSDLSRIGIRLNLRMMDFGAFLAAASRGGQGPDAAMYRMTWFADWPDPDSHLAALVTSENPYNFGGYGNPAVDELLEDARREPDNGRRADLYRQAESRVMDDAAVAPLYYYGQDVVLRPDFTGLKPSPLGIFAIAWEEMSMKP